MNFRHADIKSQSSIIMTYDQSYWKRIKGFNTVDRVLTTLDEQDLEGLENVMRNQHHWEKESRPSKVDL